LARLLERDTYRFCCAQLASVLLLLTIFSGNVAQTKIAAIPRLQKRKRGRSFSSFGLSPGCGRRAARYYALHPEHRR